MKKTLRGVLLSVPLMLAIGVEGQTPLKIAVFKSPTCGCCSMWVTHLRKAGFTATVTDIEDVTPIKDKYKVPTGTRSCHTALIDGYVVEGHVPAADIKKLIAERPAGVLGLAVGGMPIGSPGMEGTGGEPYKVLAFDAAGKTRVFSTQQPQTKPQ